MATARETTGLVKGLGLTSATMLVMGSMIGSGIFIVSAEISREVSSPALLIGAWLVTGFLTIVGALCYGELAAMMPRAGGQYVYLRESLGPLWGFLYGWTLFLVIQTGTIAAVGVAFGKFLGIFWPAISSTHWILHFWKVPKFTIGPMVLGGMDVGLNTQNLAAILVVACDRKCMQGQPSGLLGRSVVALVYFQRPLQLPFDMGPTYRYLMLRSRHDGEGGLRIIPTNVRVQCANTMNYAEMTDGRRVGFTIRHTTNWQERLKEIRQVITASRGEGREWEKFAADLNAWNVGTRQREAYLKKFIPISDDMTKVTMGNAENARHDIRRILQSATCESIQKTGYGLLMASTEWSDHVRRHRSTSSFVTRQTLIKEPHKARAASILRSMAGIKG